MQNKRVAFITIHVGINFGSVLQTIATSETLKKLGFEPIVINYIPDRATFKRYANGALKSVKKLVWRLVFLPVYLINRNVYHKYLTKFVRLSPPIYSSDDFSIKCPKADFYLTGSDQVWNSIHNEGFDSHYYFDGINPDVPRVAFCSSFGRSSLPKDEMESAKSLLKDYKAISVRENSGVDILKEVGIDCQQLVDPTFLFSKDDWKKYMSKRLVPVPYLLVYTPYNTVDFGVIYKSARLVADRFNLKVVTFSWTAKSNRNADKTFMFANPGDFLSLMYHADYVITNSFHGTAFSINLNKQFWVFQPSAFSTRINSVLKLTGLEARMLQDELSESNICDIKYSRINEILAIEKKRSLDFLTNSLK